MNKGINLGEAFSFAFKEDKWVSKVLTGGLVTIASILILPIPFLTWYQLTVFKNVLSNAKPILPEWKFSKENYILGLKVLVIGLGYSIPSLILSASDNALFALLQTAYSILLMAIIPFAIGIFAETGNIGASFDVAGIFKKIKAHIPELIVVIVGSFLAGLAALLGLIGLIIGVVFTAFWSSFVQMHLYAQVYRLAKK